MTLFSGAVSVPWTRTPTAYPGGIADTSQGAARISADIAAISYGEVVPQLAPPYSNSVVYLRAVRFTEEGPVLGAELAVPLADKIHRLVGMKEGASGEAWILTTVQDSSGVGDYWRIGRVTVNAITLAIAVSWVQEVPGRANPDLVMDLWIEQRVMAIATSFDPTNGRANRSLVLVNIDTGALVHAALPSGGFSGINAELVAVHPERQEVLVVGDRLTSGYDRPNVWLVPVTSTSIGTFVRYLPPGYPSPYSNDLYSEGWHALPLTASRWMLAGIWSTDDEYYTGDEWGSRILHNYRITGSTAAATITEFPQANAQAKGSYDGTRRPSVDLATNEGLPVVAVAEVTDRTVEAPGTGIGGVRHVELDDAGVITSSTRLAGTSNIVERDGTVSVAALGADRYIYLVGGQGITGGVVTDRQASFEFVVYAGGPVMREPEVIIPGLKGTAPEENRRVFRRVIG